MERKRRLTSKKFAEQKAADKAAGIKKGQKRKDSYVSADKAAGIRKGQRSQERSVFGGKSGTSAPEQTGRDGAGKRNRGSNEIQKEVSAGFGRRKRLLKQQTPSCANDHLDNDTKIGEDESHVEGRNAVEEVFKSGRTVDRLYILDGCQDGEVNTIKRKAAKAGIPIRYVSRERLDQMSETGKHQGVIAVIAAYHYAELEDLFAAAEKKGEDPFFILLDGIEDPHNLGAIIRTANVVGAHGVIIPKDRAVGLTATVAKASAGALNYTPVVKVTNLAGTIEELQKRGLWFVCADMDGTPMTKLNLSGPIGLVIGSEGDGVSRLVREKCDIVAAIPQHGEINSLNASVAMAVLSYEIARQRGI